MMVKTLKSVDEHNAEAQAAFAERFKPIGTGVACPKCGGELTRSPCFSYSQAMGGGSGQTQFVATCAPCGLHVTLWAK